MFKFMLFTQKRQYVYVRHEFNDLDYKDKTYIYVNLKSTLIYIFSLGIVHSGLEVK